jgi:hypothetical protein
LVIYATAWSDMLKYICNSFNLIRFGILINNSECNDGWISSESPDLLLLIQNKGKGPLSVTISAPAFVQLEERNVQIQEKEHKKVLMQKTKFAISITNELSFNKFLAFVDIRHANTFYPEVFPFLY